MKKIKLLLAFAFTALLIQGCTTKTSQSVPKDGILTKDEVTFPDIDKIWLDGPAFPSKENLAKIEKGMSKDQIRMLIGHPHFAEGLYAVVEWDYLFNLKEKAGDPDKICQYKVVFDENYTAQSFFWQPKNCLSDDVVMDKPIDLETLFEFDSAIVVSKYYDKIAKMAKFANKTGANLLIEGHTDSIGNDNYNLKLSQKRANAVRELMIKDYGVNPNKIKAVGYGETKPIATNSTDEGRKQNRRVTATAYNKK
ncbi:OmpA domain-containing protein [Campylobacter blaseri]|uniref:Plastocyanin n=1 Tax=Campylobacter blaseri TaxID=2042961 RepID=A0A2P8R3X8_9BACT|nr:OmpA family protein [Campylobacter blaseri]PSM53212.1 plastocyanin [Campylobacter blaseri]PSM54678.1 plastocyanin [Campylobacter blaseri]QKF86845.1 OmpA domain-containing protein [Campylobacter blaseri]